MAMQESVRISVSNKREIWDNLTSPIRQEGGQVLTAIASYIWKVATRMVKTANGENDHGKPGKAPKAHGIAIYKKLFQFAVDKVNLIAYVGASLKDNAKRNSAGQTVASVMEEGGEAIVTNASPTWLYKTKVPVSANTETGMADYFMKMRSAPIMMAGSNDWKAHRIAKTYLGKGNKEGKEVEVQYVKIRSQRQALHAARFVISLFGYPHPAIAKAKKIEARPVFSVALQKAQKFIQRQMEKLFRNKTKKAS